MGPKQVKGRAQVSMMDTGRGWRARKGSEEEDRHFRMRTLAVVWEIN